ncbi:efflux RND transporter permease subunit [Erythrobacter sp. WG]|uniref:efflux RND transporter permease subunit n=1 Tax=Erythrobacter sp. WG TaxID=2985510 RepID=UPI00226E1B40|nr:efflux RND transporter permease subunit [Erythrobacter sp. WG]MCX9147944.1 efflux RND transporter permease subunit [Erythrobacter sp. WG]
MSLRVSAWGIRNPIPVSVLFLALALAGIASYFLLPIKQFPDVSFPVVQVSVTQNGAAPGELETQVTRPVEDAVAGIAGVKTVQSTVVLGGSTTTIEFQIGEDEQKVTDEVRTRIAQIRASLPRDIDEPIVQRLEVTNAPIATWAVAAPGMTVEQLSWFIDNDLTRRLQGLPGVAQVSRIGGVEREINVTLDLDRMRGLGLTAPDVNQALSRFNLDAPGGTARVGAREQTIRVLGEAETIDALRALTIPTGQGRQVRLADVASIGPGAAEERAFARLDGRPVVGFQVNKTNQASDIAVEDAVIAALEQLEAERKDVTVTKLVSTVDETRASYSATVHVLIEGMLLAALVVFFFLRDWRATAIAAVAMPLSLVPTFTFMLWFGFSLNIVTLLALTLVIGILVDDAIVEVENIEKRIERGESPYKAAFFGADEIGLAVVATTMTIVVVFVPVSFMGGMAGQYFREFGLTVAVSVLLSLLVARLVTPLMAAYFLKDKKRHTERPPFEGRYRRTLDWALDNRWKAVGLGGAFFAGSLFLASLLPTAFVPATDSGFLYLKLEGSPGSTARDMERIVADTTRILRREPDVANVFAQVGSTASVGPNLGAAGVTDGTITVVLKKDRQLSTEAFKQTIRPLLRRVPDARVTTQGGWGTADVEIILASNDGDALQVAADRLQREMRGLKIISDVRTTTPPPGGELIIRPRPADAARLNVTSDALASIMRVATIGDIDANVPKLSEGERRIPIRVRLPEGAQTDLATLGALQVPTSDGRTTALSAVADLSFEAGPAQIQRFDRERRIAVQADLNGAPLGTALAAIGELPAFTNLPAGVRHAAYGEAADLADLQRNFGLAIAAGVLLIVGVLILLFRSFFLPITILSALPLSVGGAFLALLVTGLSLSLPAMIGFLMLLGLAAKNSILLVEYAIEREREGMGQREAIIAACRERARPIVMTTLAMMVGMLPTALAIGEGAEFRQPMAVAVIGGLISSTVLSLVLVPVVYEIIDGFERRIKPRLAALVTAPPEDAHRLDAEGAG